ncbi:MAG TPA: hypothetical protein VFS74_03140 [Gemmatimonadales bacterium]|nr:hypothetical protein [Gemmatimonadales bacterium]
MINAPQSSFALRHLPACALALLLGAAPLAAQGTAHVRATEIRKAPSGTLLARTTTATDLAVTGRQSGWRQVRLRGWVSTSLLKRDSRDGFDVIVTARNVRLRSAPSGKELAQLEEGMLLNRLETRGSWTRVERAVWVPADAVVAAKAVASKAPAAEKAQAYQQTPSGGPVTTSSVPPQPEAQEHGRAMAAARNTALLASPDAVQSGTLLAGAPVRVLSSAGSWSRVQLEAWVRTDDLVPSDSAAQGVTAAEVRADPERFVGKQVEWRVQYISTASADELRPEMPPGQPYMLARGPLPEPGFVYVMLSRDDSARVATLPALAELTIRAKVRAARSRFLSTSVVELVSIIAPEVPR